MIKEIKLDSMGENLLIVKNAQGCERIFLKLKIETNREREIGYIPTDKNFIVMVRVKEKHFFRKCNGYGINEYVLRNIKQINSNVSFVLLKDERCKWMIPVDYIIEESTYGYYKKQGFELQKFISLDKIDQFRTM